ncbi:GntG family PLP-dependent aldolase [Ralstonia sp.]|uniref:threonine aldolase family protein n=1 Tax=Ralstonia sp. TaxID=54061 RepID=UPI0031D6BAE3
MTIINLYSDTQSQPSAQMRDAMCRSAVGDEQKGTDPTVTALLEAVAERLGKEAAIFLPSGTMCNAIAVAVHCKKGDAILTEASSHMMRYEAGGMSALTGAIPEAIDGIDGQYTLEQVQRHFHPGSRYTPATTLLTVEQTCNLAGGRVWPVAQLNEVAIEARRLGMKTHMDGARLFNAAVATNRPPSEHCKHFDSVWVDFTKGLGAPFGAVLCGSREFIDQAWNWKHRFGGAMRQAGIMAGACLYALEHNVERLAEDHGHAARLNDGLKSIPGIRVRHTETETNILYFEVTEPGVSAEVFLQRLAANGLKIGIVGSGFRVVTYPGIGASDIEAALEIIRNTLEEMRGKKSL